MLNSSCDKVENETDKRSYSDPDVENNIEIRKDCEEVTPFSFVNDDQVKQLIGKYKDEQSCHFNRITSLAMFTDFTQLLADIPLTETLPQDNSQSGLNKMAKQVEINNPVFLIEKGTTNMLDKTNKISPFSTELIKSLNMSKEDLNMIIMEMEEVLKMEENNIINSGASEVAKLEKRKKIEKYREKRNKRCWERSVIYDCRRHAAKLRNRVHGRFAGKSIEKKDPDFFNGSNKIFQAPPILWKPIFAFSRTERPARKFEQ
eukprot:TRINITY_DN76_c0_g1_i1.p1 TRINITY_DN76_c0_g1~~TRINITY_DN76_c0_g1_i1.p1  ORF type:complete len:260 (+),score=37.27 TRINITY_DN76_c0_g1_i1:153-932(+)